MVFRGVPRGLTPIRPGEVAVGDCLEWWTTEDGQSSGEVAFVRSEAVFETLGETAGAEKLSVLPAEAHPLCLKMRDFFANSLEVFHSLGAEDVCFAFILPRPDEHAGAGIEVEAAGEGGETPDGDATFGNEREVGAIGLLQGGF